MLGQDPGDHPVAELGLDSLTIADLAAALQRRYGRPVLPSIIMRANTIDDIAAALAPNSPTAAASSGDPDPLVPPPTPTSATCSVPCWPRTGRADRCSRKEEL